MKDAKGHGSDGRGGPAAIMQKTNAMTKPVKLAGSVLSTVQSNPGGFSVTPKGQMPTDGFMVSLPGRSQVLTEEQLRGPAGQKILQDYATKNSDVLRQKGAHIGGWTDKESGKTYLDVSHNIKDRNKAISAGKKHNQIAIWDVKNSAEVRTGGTGE